MPSSPPTQINLPPPAFPQGPPPQTPSPGTPTPKHTRVSFGHKSFRRGSLRPKYANPDDDLGTNDGYDGFESKPAIPSALPNQDDTPLPILPMIVLSIALLGEFLSANVSTPFLLFMVEGFGVEKSQVGSSTGVLVSTFFITQFLTSVLWAAVADKHGRRAVLFISLLGNSLTCLAFGTARSFPEAVAIRLMQGVFNGSIGVARGAVSAVTDSTNEARAYATIGFSWGLGGVAGAVIGGAFETPAKRWPNGVGGIRLFVDYPYLLPCGIAASITFLGAILSLFLGWDGGPREGLIRLPLEKDGEILPTVTEMRESPNPTPSGSRTPNEDRPETVVNRVVEQTKVAQKKLSGYFARRVREAYGSPSPRNTPLVASNQNLPVPGSTRTKSRALSIASQRTGGQGSAYGYGAGMRSRLASSVGGRSPGAALRRRRLTGQSYGGAPMDEGGPVLEDLNFAQRLLLANEANVTSMANLWVAAAINADNEDPFLDDSDVDLTPGGDGEEGAPPFTDEPGESGSVFDMDDELNSRPATPGAAARRASSSRPSFSSTNIAPRARATLGGFAFGPLTQINAPSPRPTQRDVSPSQTPRTHVSQFPASPRFTARRGSSVSNLGLPAIYNNMGLSSPQYEYPPLTTPEGELEDEDEERRIGGGHIGHLSVISEGSTSMTDIRSMSTGTAQGAAVAAEVPVIKEPSVWSQLPLVIIVQYGILALHNTVHDQYFLSYLVSPYSVGGLGLNAAHFAQLIALMCGAQIFYQFYLYPNIGPPRGAWSHLAMFRIGSALFIPSYLSVVLYRAFAHEAEDGNMVVMALLTLSTAIRYCGSTFTYTAISILLNYMSPPHLVSLSNSLGQSTVALARFLGPILGGYLWSASIQDGPGGYPLGFYVVSAVCALAILHSFTIR